MLDIDFTFLWTAINLVVLYLILNKVLFKKIGNYMNERSKSIEENMSKGEATKAEGEEYRKEQMKLRNDAVDERKEIISDAKIKAQKEADAIVTDARKEASTLISLAHDEIARERQRSMRELRNEVASLALAAASKVIEANMDSEKNRKLIDEFLNKEGVA